MEKNNLIITIVAVVIVGVLGFYGGMQYQKSQKGSFSGKSSAGPNMQGASVRQGDGAVNNRPISGEITTVDDESITIKTQDTGSKIIIISDSTTINKTASGSKSDLSTGVQITVSGSENSDGTVSAQSVYVGTGMLTNTPPNGVRQPGQSVPAATE